MTMPPFMEDYTEDYVYTSKPWINDNIRANGIRFHIVEYPSSHATDSRAPLILFTHGFAENWYVYAQQLKYFSHTPYRAIAYDARGYGATDKPPLGYDAWTLAADIKGIIDALGYTEAIIIAADDGGIPAWTFASLHPSMTTALITINSPHPLSMLTSTLQGRSMRFLLYWLKYQIPFISSHNLAKHHAKAVINRLRAYGYNPWIASPEFTHYGQYLQNSMQIRTVNKHALKRHHWVFRSSPVFEGHRFREALRAPITVPVLTIYGKNTPLISTHAQKDTLRRGKNITSVTVDAAHFPYLEQPERINVLIETFLHHQKNKSCDLLP